MKLLETISDWIIHIHFWDDKKSHILELLSLIFYNDQAFHCRFEMEPCNSIEWWWFKEDRTKTLWMNCDWWWFCKINGTIIRMIHQNCPKWMGWIHWTILSRYKKLWHIIRIDFSWYGDFSPPNPLQIQEPTYWDLLFCHTIKRDDLVDSKYGYNHQFISEGFPGTATTLPILSNPLIYKVWNCLLLVSSQWANNSTQWNDLPQLWVNLYLCTFFLILKKISQKKLKIYLFT